MNRLFLETRFTSFFHKYTYSHKFLFLSVSALVFSDLTFSLHVASYICHVWFCDFERVKDSEFYNCLYFCSWSLTKNLILCDASALPFPHAHLACVYFSEILKHMELTIFFLNMP